MKAYSDYLLFEPDHFLRDPSFRRWVARPTPEMNAYWKGLLYTHPHLRASFEQAQVLAQGMQATWVTFPDAYTNGLYQQLLTALPVEPPQMRSRRMADFVPRWAYAAAASVVLIAGLWGYGYFFREQTVQTGNAELRTVTLYDGSVVTLNANSWLRFPSRRDWQRQRQVWLSGEGAFAVRRQPGDQTASFRKFTVHTHRADVVVLGTHFTVYTRPRRTQVLLEEGCIALTDPATHQTRTMQPGQVVAYINQQPAPQVNQLAPDRQRPLTAWRENRLVFENASMDELTRRFREVYGLELVLRNKAFAGQEFRGELPVDDLDRALLIIAETFDLKPVRQDDLVYFIEN